jgi:hypothetical protein
MMRAQSKPPNLLAPNFNRGQDVRVANDPTPCEPEFDAAAFVEGLRRGREEQELVAAQRPTAGELAYLLRHLANLVYRGFDVERESGCIANGVDPRNTYSWQPMAGSPAHADVTVVDGLLESFVAGRELTSLEFADTNPLRSSIVWGIGLLAQCVHTAVDHLHGIADALEAGRTIRAPLTMSRTVLEAAATGSYVADLGVDSRERLRRAHNLRMEDLTEGANHRLDDGDEDYLTGLQELVEFAEASGFGVRQPRLRHMPPSIPAPAGENESIRVLIERILPGIGLSAYRILSRVAHCRPNVGDVLPDEYALPHEVAVWRKTEKIAWYVIPTLLAIHEMAPRIATYLGWNDHEIGETIERTINVFSIGAGWKDPEIREALGLPAL